MEQLLGAIIGLINSLVNIRILDLNRHSRCCWEGKWPMNSASHNREVSQVARWIYSINQSFRKLPTRSGYTSF
jgi:hypothetical protein